MEGVPGQTPRFRRLLQLSAAVCLALCAAVVVRRGLAIWEAAHVPPGVCTSTGYEEESLLGVWRAVHDQPIFPNPAAPPYAAAYFNWLFYQGYALPVRVAVLHWGDPVLPLAGRALTALGALVGGVLLYRLLAPSAGHRLFAAAVAGFGFTGPLLGWWICTVRPDVWALTFELGGTFALLRWYDRRPVAAIGGALACFYVAWACKQTAVGFLGTAVVFLAWRRQWGAAATLAAGSVALWVATLGWLGPSYRAALHAGVSEGVFDAESGWRNFADAAAKSAPIGLLAAAAARLIRRPATTPPFSDVLVYGAIGTVLTFPLFFVAAFKLGAWSNYYFAPVIMLALVGYSAHCRLGPSGRSVVVCVAMSVLQLAILVEAFGRVTLQGASQQMARRWRVWSQEAEPRFSSDIRYNLPWLNPRSPPFVLAYNYPLERYHGRPFAEGGIGGLIESGYFASLFLPARTGDTYDGGSLRRYRRVATFDGMSVYRRISPPASP